VHLAFSSDGSQLIAANRDSHSIHLWDLRAIRAYLKEMGLDWDLPDYPPEPSLADRPEVHRLDVTQASANRLAASGSSGPPVDVAANEMKARGLHLWKAGKIDEATTELLKALDILPNEDPWYGRRARMLRDLAADPELFAHLLKAYDRDAVRIARGRWHAQHMRWRHAIGEYEQVVQTRSLGDEWVEYALLLLLAEDTEKYVEFMHWMIEKIGTPNDPMEAYVLAWSNSLSTQPVASAEQGLVWAELGKERARGGTLGMHLLGLANLRSGRFAQAKACFEASRMQGYPTGAASLNLLALALAEFYAGNHAAGAEWLAQGGPGVSTDGLYSIPNVWLTMHLLFREASQVAASHRTKSEGEKESKRDTAL
jgi:hypothetical protein